jgi:hypothetical protein
MKNRIIIIAIITFISQIAIGQEKKPISKMSLNVDLGLIASQNCFGTSINLGTTYRFNNNIFALKNNIMNEIQFNLFGKSNIREKFNHTSFSYGKTMDYKKINFNALVGLGLLTGIERNKMVSYTGEFFDRYIEYDTKKIEAITFPLELGK